MGTATTVVVQDPEWILMARLMKAGAAAAALVIAGAGMAVAATKGTITLDTKAAHFKGAYNFKHHVSGPQYATAVSGRFTNTENDHAYLQARSDGYGYVSLASLDAKGTTKVSKIIGAGDVLVAKELTVKACESHWGPDVCRTGVYQR
ncbi:hypothetical protein [Arsenicicoccus dermatophilus]|uniref:hypothetical protein n=1 Tax=Arsenicicoccus dermatophilus TaxID=1076331 RepID=UPI0039172583